MRASREGPVVTGATKRNEKDGDELLTTDEARLATAATRDLALAHAQSIRDVTRMAQCTMDLSIRATDSSKEPA